MPSIDDSKCCLVTGATSGIGRALALAISELPSKPTVIAAGRRQKRLDELAPKLETLQLDMGADRVTLKKLADHIVDKYPDLDSVVLAAGIQHQLDYTKPGEIDPEKIASEVNINYTSIVTLIGFLLPHFLKLAAQGRPCFIIPVSSGLGIVPAPGLPNYSASKAALHSFCLSLSVQLEGSNVHVLEIIPPLVESELHDPYGTTAKLSKLWMPLNEYTRVTLESLRKGENQIITGQMITERYKQFEEGKLEVASQVAKGLAKLLQGD